jgi:hypothetical protein
MISAQMMKFCEQHARNAARVAADNGFDSTPAGLWLVAVGLRLVLKDHPIEDDLEYHLAGEALSHVIKILMQRNVDIAARTMTDQQLAQFKETTSKIMRDTGMIATQ